MNEKLNEFIEQLQENPMNPRTYRDCEPPLITKGGRDYGDNEYNIDIKLLIRNKLNTKNMYKIAQVLGYEKYDIEKEKEYYSDKKSIEVIDDYLYNELDDTDQIEAILDILKIENHKRQSRGYSQGDCLDCILIATDERKKQVGIKKKDIAKSLKESSKVFDARAWGEVYGFEVIEYKDLFDSNGVLSSEKEEEIIESCSGFYGDSGLEQIFEEVKCHGITEEMFDNAKENIVC